MDMRQFCQRHIVIVGAGPSTVYFLDNLVAFKEAKTRITIIEERNVSGEGEPFSAEGAFPALLSNLNIAEIPAFSNLNVPFPDINSELTEESSVVSRGQVGSYFSQAFSQALHILREQGHHVRFIKNKRVSLITTQARGGVEVKIADETLYADKLILNIGAACNKRAPRQGYYPVYPASAYALKKVSHYHILGCSMSAMDAAFAISCTRGTFERRDGKLVYTTSERFTIELSSPTGMFPQIFYSMALQNSLMSYLKQQCFPPYGKALDKIGECFFTLLQAFCEPTYNQVRSMSFEQALTYLLGRRKYVNPFQKLKVDLLTSKTLPNPSFLWPTILEATLRYAEQHIEQAKSAIASHDRLKRLLKASMASIPYKSCEKLLALNAAGILRVSRKADAQRVVPIAGEVTNERLYIDGRGYLEVDQGLKVLASMIQTDQSAIQTRRRSRAVWVNSDQRIIVNEQVTDIYTGSGYLTPGLIRIPGLDTCSSLAAVVYEGIITPEFMEKEAG